MKVIGILSSNAGWYLGILKDGLPYDRLSEYFDNKEDLIDHLDKQKVKYRSSVPF